MYTALEYLTYLLGVLVFTGLFFGVTVLLMLTQYGAERLTKATRHLANQARVFAADLAHNKKFRRTQSST